MVFVRIHDAVQVCLQYVQKMKGMACEDVGAAPRSSSVSFAACGSKEMIPAPTPSRSVDKESSFFRDGELCNQAALGLPLPSSSRSSPSFAIVSVLGFLLHSFSAVVAFFCDGNFCDPVALGLLLPSSSAAVAFRTFGGEFCSLVLWLLLPSSLRPSPCSAMASFCEEAPLGSLLPSSSAAVVGTLVGWQEDGGACVQRRSRPPEGGEVRWTECSRSVASGRGSSRKKTDK
ncbi:hypothetical protein AXF42_Ash017727 [Apostasia shenzhenica]|uniref:Uncharacterized protein n=1 Tax=Apostasia shenzhenica TaxID=1088818 RepID=A0A2I0B635_9ASPA|nr:hypothetical protein AXF42_Ash017727 [Apostasia shenzhenica]